jgi:hypothetical protein
MSRVLLVVVIARNYLCLIVFLIFELILGYGPDLQNDVVSKVRKCLNTFICLQGGMVTHTSEIEVDFHSNFVVSLGVKTSDSLRRNF